MVTARQITPSKEVSDVLANVKQTKHRLYAASNDPPLTVSPLVLAVPLELRNLLDSSPIAQHDACADLLPPWH
jgi:hypothetical protein